MPHDETDPLFVVSHIYCLEMLGLILEKGATFESYKSAIPILFDQATTFILNEMRRYPAFDWQSILITCPNFTREACNAIQRNCPELIEKFKEFVPSLN